MLRAQQDCFVGDTGGEVKLYVTKPVGSVCTQTCTVEEREVCGGWWEKRGHASVAQPLINWAVVVVPKVAQSAAAYKTAKQMEGKAGTVHARLASSNSCVGPAKRAFVSACSWMDHATMAAHVRKPLTVVCVSAC